MIIRNKKTRNEVFVTAEGWAAIQAHPDLKDKYVVVDSKEVKDAISAAKIKAVVPQEILDFRNKKTTELKNNETQKTKKKKA